MAEDKGLSRSQREEKVLQFWKDNKIFEKTLEKKSPKGDFIFYEGPPTANAKPAFHHLEARVFKDALPRYKTMRGYRVPRRAGWDTHGLPVELQIEKKLGFTSKKDIEAYGIEKFNTECKQSVFDYIGDWEKFTERIGYWTDFDKAYYTFDNSYIETVWKIIAHVNKRKLLYKDYKVVPWCPRCGTGLSSHELGLDAYHDIKDLSVYAEFKVVGEDNTYFIAWTTTPWTLPGNVALAVGKDITYVTIEKPDEGTGPLVRFVLAKDRLESIFGTEGYEIVEERKGSELVGLAYEPLYTFITPNDKAYKIYAADFVNTEDGTGIVHTAVMYGQDDFELGTKVGLPKQHLVDDTGHFMQNTSFLSGRYIRETDENGKPTLAVDIIDDLKKRGLFFDQANIKHSYPHCWRCKTPLIYYARDSWYIRMSDLRKDLVKENEKINWEPEHIKEGRFGEWLREVKDWALSRERYWGTPLPVWENEDGERIVVDSVDTLRKYAKTSGNTYFVMRHGGTEGNKHEIVSYKGEANDHLTESGRLQARSTAKDLRKQKIDVIVSSPFARTRETAKIVQEELGLPESAVILDERLREIDPGEFDGKNWNEYHNYMYTTGPDWYERSIPGGESLADVGRRTGAALYDLEQKYAGKNILIVTHGGAAWLAYVVSGLYEPTREEYKPADTHVFIKKFKRFANAEVRELPFVPLPHNANFMIDLHKPFIDDIVLIKDGKEYRRTKEVMDVWLDSGSMPFAQDPENVLYPADFISEAVDQTRGWFYTLHAVGVLMEKGRAFKNAICLGHILDKEGRKMSKSIGNILDPWELIEKHGVDTLRLWMYSVNQPGESKNFDERSVDEINKKIFNLLDNVYTFYDLYRDRTLEANAKPGSVNILDIWIVTRLNQLIEEMTESLDAYKLLEPTRAMREYIDDLSTWYLRRSRDRLKEGDEDAKRTLYVVLKTISKLLAPFAPFAAEDLYQKLRTDSDPMSVHLESWPESKRFDKEVLGNMKLVRDVVSEVLMIRSKENIKIRQPLNLLKIQDDRLKNKNEFVGLIKDEVNVKEIEFDKMLSTGFWLDITLTPELVEEGRVREIIRSIQDMRKEKNLNPTDTMSYIVPEEERDLFAKFGAEIRRVTNITTE